MGRSGRPSTPAALVRILLFISTFSPLIGIDALSPSRGFRLRPHSGVLSLWASPGGKKPGDAGPGPSSRGTTGPEEYGPTAGSIWDDAKGVIYGAADAASDLAAGRGGGAVPDRLADGYRDVSPAGRRATEAKRAAAAAAVEGELDFGEEPWEVEQLFDLEDARDGRGKGGGPLTGVRATVERFYGVSDAVSSALRPKKSGEGDSEYVRQFFDGPAVEDDEGASRWDRAKDLIWDAADLVKEAAAVAKDVAVAAQGAPAALEDAAVKAKAASEAAASAIRSVPPKIERTVDDIRAAPARVGRAAEEIADSVAAAADEIAAVPSRVGRAAGEATDSAKAAAAEIAATPSRVKKAAEEAVDSAGAAVDSVTAAAYDVAATPGRIQRAAVDVGTFFALLRERGKEEPVTQPPSDLKPRLEPEPDKPGIFGIGKFFGGRGNAGAGAEASKVQQSAGIPLTSTGGGDGLDREVQAALELAREALEIAEDAKRPDFNPPIPKMMERTGAGATESKRLQDSPPSPMMPETAEINSEETQLSIGVSPVSAEVDAIEADEFEDSSSSPEMQEATEVDQAEKVGSEESPAGSKFQKPIEADVPEPTESDTTEKIFENDLYTEVDASEVKDLMNEPANAGATETNLFEKDPLAPKMIDVTVVDATKNKELKEDEPVQKIPEPTEGDSADTEISELYKEVDSQKKRVFELYSPPGSKVPESVEAVTVSKKQELTEGDAPKEKIFELYGPPGSKVPESPKATAAEAEVSEEDTPAPKVPESVEAVTVSKKQELTEGDAPKERIFELYGPPGSKVPESPKATTADTEVSEEDTLAPKVPESVEAVTVPKKQELTEVDDALKERIFELPPNATAAKTEVSGGDAPAPSDIPEVVSEPKLLEPTDVIAVTEMPEPIKVKPIEVVAGPQTPQPTKVDVAKKKVASTIEGENAKIQRIKEKTGKEEEAEGVTIKISDYVLDLPQEAKAVGIFGRIGRRAKRILLFRRTADDATEQIEKEPTVPEKVDVQSETQEAKEAVRVLARYIGRRAKRMLLFWRSANYATERRNGGETAAGDDENAPASGGAAPAADGAGNVLTNTEGRKKGGVLQRAKRVILFWR